MAPSSKCGGSHSSLFRNDRQFVFDVFRSCCPIRGAHLLHLLHVRRVIGQVQLPQPLLFRFACCLVARPHSHSIGPTFGSSFHEVGFSRPASVGVLLCGAGQVAHRLVSGCTSLVHLVASAQQYSRDWTLVSGAMDCIRIQLGRSCIRPARSICPL